MRYLPAHKVRSIALKALASGGHLRPFMDGRPSRTVYWNVAGRCEAPVPVLLHGRRELKQERYAVMDMTDHDTKPWFVELDTPCRKCQTCLWARQARWRGRARAEVASATRTWLATLTLAPATYQDVLNRCRVYLAKGGVDADGLPPDELFVMVVDELYSGAIADAMGLSARDTVQKWLKRLRANSAAPIRFLCVNERHKSGIPHLHVLLHEQDVGKPLRYDRVLKGSWRGGFASFKLVRDTAGALYVAKYLGKELAAQVRASKFYGSPAGEHGRLGARLAPTLWGAA